MTPASHPIPSWAVGLATLDCGLEFKLGSVFKHRYGL